MVRDDERDEDEREDASERDDETDAADPSDAPDKGGDEDAEDEAAKHGDDGVTDKDDDETPKDDDTPKDEKGGGDDGDANGDASKGTDKDDTDDRPVAAAPGGAGSPPPSDRKAAAWGRPLARLDAAWTKWEGWLCAVVLLLEIVVLSLWVALKGLSTPVDSGSNAGIVFRALFGANVLGLAAFLAVRKKPKRIQRPVTVIAVLAGMLLAKSWGNVGVQWSSNLLNCYQQASSLTLLGGLRGVGTRLTLLLALLGGSLATANGKHITIDLVTRFLKPTARLPVVIVGWLGAAVICASASWGFFDYISIEQFEANADATAGEKVGKVVDGIGEDWFIARKQIGLDFRTLPHVMKGEPYAEWLGGKEWNEWLDSSGFVERYGREKIDQLKMSEDIKRSPIVVVPERGEPRGELINAANLVFPIGLLIIAIRFVLLSLLAISGHSSVDPEAHVEGSDIQRKHEESIEEIEHEGEEEQA